jgi:DNA adenine methylase
MIFWNCQINPLCLNYNSPTMRKQTNPVPYNSYPGGKSGDGTFQAIINHIPPHRCFMSLFAGNCGIFKNIRKPEWAILNDIDTNVMNDWYTTGLSLAGDVRFYNMDAITFLDTVLRTAEYTRLLKDTFIYLDPPYKMDTRKFSRDLYEFEMSDTDHENLLIKAVNIPCMVMISHYPCDLYNDMLSGWNTFDYMSNTRGAPAMERIYMNYHLDGHLHDYSYIGGNFREREKYKRIKTNLFAKLDRMQPLLRNALLQEYELQYRNKYQ